MSTQTHAGAFSQFKPADLVVPTTRMLAIGRLTEAGTCRNVAPEAGFLAIGTMINRNTVKSNEFSVQPSHAAIQACHWSLVGSFHQGTFVIAVADMVHSLFFCESLHTT